VPVEVLVCDGSARGAETDAARWRRVGGGGAPLTLPLLSWMDAAPAYGALPLDAPVPLAPGATVGVCVRTGDVQGLALRVDKAQRPPAAAPLGAQGGGGRGASGSGARGGVPAFGVWRGPLAGAGRGACRGAAGAEGARGGQAMTAGDTDFLDDDFGGAADDDIAGRAARTYFPGEVTSSDACLEVCCGYSVVAKAFDAEPSSDPVTAAFVGEVEYTVV